ncbi:hypothetical protein [Candidatus Kryptobacter tengchongensis]|uniref:Uncharacterized protein n=1 Tax=Kryptobacter tengchongensis TaxID=1643429 RepID=A0A916LI85_KRYT1|nr:hypothetical protein [Candidatus Kryptobacter tengchongensis]CUS96170.1 hypothetical protein JGI25_00063 [Candidatus Kryptobacter tengchongensis]
MGKIEIVKEITPNCIEADEWKFYNINLGQNPKGKAPLIWFSPSYVNPEGKIIFPM